MASPPELHIESKPKKPSDWSPRPIPPPGPERRTADPRTPTARELAARAQQRASVVAPAAAPAATEHAPQPLPGGTCGGGWAAVAAERDRILASGGPTDNAIQRNGPISAAYAQYYERNSGNQWAGLASIVSRQARCAMEHARDAMGPINYDYYYRQLPEAAAEHAPLYTEPPVAGPVALSAMTAYDALAKTNKVIFSDIYPVLRFEEQYGGDALDRCGPSRPGGPVDPTVSRALHKMHDPDPDVRTFAGGTLANYEQRTIVQSQVLNDGPTRAVFATNQWMADSMGGVGTWLGARKPEVALSAGCNDGTPTVPFEGSFLDPNARVGYYNNRLVPALKALGPDRLSGIVGAIAGGR